jgi:hypothetical protein
MESVHCIGCRQPPYDLSCRYESAYYLQGHVVSLIFVVAVILLPLPPVYMGLPHH